VQREKELKQAQQLLLLKNQSMLIVETLWELQNLQRLEKKFQKVLVCLKNVNNQKRIKSSPENRRVNSQACRIFVRGIFFGRHRLATTMLLKSAVEAGL
jgi:hypothetical protein